MPNARISMSKLKQIVQLQSSNLSARDLSRALGISIGAVSKYLAAVRAAGLSWEVAQGLDEAALERRIFGDPAPAMPGRFAPVDCAWIHGELKRHRHVTLQLLWEEYRARHGEQSYRYSPFCEHYRAWEKRLKRLDAPAALCRREAVRRLRGPDGAGLRDARGRGVPRAHLRRCAGRERLCLCGGDAHGGAARAPCRRSAVGSLCCIGAKSGRDPSDLFGDPPAFVGPQRLCGTAHLNRSDNSDQVRPKFRLGTGGNRSPGGDYSR